METTQVVNATGTTPVVSESNQIAAKKSKPVKQKSKIATWPLTAKKGVNALPTFDLANITKGIGEVLNKYPVAFTIRVLGKDIEVPALSDSNDNRERAFIMFKKIVKIVFGTMEVDQVLAKNDKGYMVIEGLQKAGFKFKVFCKAQVLPSVNSWHRHKKAAKSLHRQVVNTLNAQRIAETNAMLAKAKELREKNDVTIKALQEKATKLIGF